MRQFLCMLLCVLSLTSLTACGVRAVPDDDALSDAPDERDEDWEKSWDEAWSEWSDSWAGADSADGEAGKAHRYQILDGREAELYTIAGETQVEALDGLLGNIGQVQSEEASEGDGEIACIYVLQQEKTLLAGQDPDSRREYEEVARFTVYQDRNLVTMQFLKGSLADTRLGDIKLEDLLTFTVSVSEETMETLRNPAQFAEETAG